MLVVVTLATPPSQHTHIHSHVPTLRYSTKRFRNETKCSAFRMLPGTASSTTCSAQPAKAQQEEMVRRRSSRCVVCSTERSKFHHDTRHTCHTRTCTLCASLWRTCAGRIGFAMTASVVLSSRVVLRPVGARDNSNSSTHRHTCEHTQTHKHTNTHTHTDGQTRHRHRRTNTTQTQAHLQRVFCTLL